MIKKLFILWYQGFENAPFVVKKCLESWKFHNPTWEIIELDSINLIKYIDIDLVIDRTNKTIGLTELSDIIRFILLNTYGGLWVDSTCFCTISLDTWLDNYVKTGFFAFDKPGPDRLLSTWFLYAEKNNYLLQCWLDAVINYWKEHNKIHHYFAHHYLFGKLYNQDLVFKNLWLDVPKISADGPHYLLHKGLLNNLTSEIKDHIDNKIVPLYKLTYKYDIKKYNNKCILSYILNDISNIKLIHIGKCAGTLIQQQLGTKEYHLKKPVYNINHKYIIWIRNPIDRFVSAFNFAYTLITDDISKYNSSNLTIDNCLAPMRIKYKMNHEFTFSPEYDQLVLFFKTANALAEGLTHIDNDIKNKALILMTSPIEHIYKGIGYYLDNGEFIKNHHKNILFIGCVENINEDCQKLSLILNKKIDSTKKVRENTKYQEKYLSSIAIKNLRNFYKDTDYKALQEMYKHRFISLNVLQEYYQYTG